MRVLLKQNESKVKDKDLTPIFSQDIIKLGLRWMQYIDAPFL